jgi:hypothetical protein
MDSYENFGNVEIGASLHHHLLAKIFCNKNPATGGMMKEKFSHVNDQLKQAG